MADAAKHVPLHSGTLVADVKSLISLVKARRTTIAFAYGFMLAFVAVTVFLAFSPSSNSSAPWFTNIFSTSFSPSSDSQGSQLSSIFSYFLPNSSSTSSSSSSTSSSSSSSSFSSQEQKQVHNLTSSLPASTTSSSRSGVNNQPILRNSTSQPLNATSRLPSSSNAEFQPPNAPKELSSSKNNASLPTPSGTKVQPPITVTELARSKNNATVTEGGTQAALNAPQTSPTKENSGQAQESKTNHTAVAAQKPPVTANSPEKTGTGEKSAVEKGVSSNNTTPLAAVHVDGTKQESPTVSGSSAKQGIENLIQSLMNCDLFDGNWVKDKSYPLYKPGSCSFIDDQFNCILNGRPDTEYQKYKWQPKACTLPRLDGVHMLELLRDKRLAFVGDSLNRNMWESLVCILKNSAKDPGNVYEANGRSYFRGEASYSFVFKDYNCTVEFFVSPFLVREWEVSDNNGTKKETLRLDLVGKSSDAYRGADIIIFNTGHWWTHEKTSRGKDYYQEGSHVYGDLNVLEAFRKALTTWARWVDGNVNTFKSMVFFRGYSVTHFSGGQWNSGGACDSETEPIKNEKYLAPYPSKMLVLEHVLKGMKNHVTYLNISRLTDYRKDGHPSVYRKHKYNNEEKKAPLRFQDCSHWCLPGVPDAWNELLYAELLVKENKMRQHQRKS